MSNRLEDFFNRDEAERINSMDTVQLKLIDIFKKIQAGKNLSEIETNFLEKASDAEKAAALESIDAGKSKNEEIVTEPEAPADTNSNKEPELTEDELKSAQGILDFLKMRGIEYDPDSASLTEAFKLTGRDKKAIEHLLANERQEAFARKEQGDELAKQAFYDEDWEKTQKQTEQDAEDKEKRRIQMQNMSADNKNYKLNEKSYDTEHSAQTSGAANDENGWSDEKIKGSVMQPKNTFEAKYGDYFTNLIDNIMQDNIEKGVKSSEAIGSIYGTLKRGALAGGSEDKVKDILVDLRRRYDEKQKEYADSKKSITKDKIKARNKLDSKETTKMNQAANALERLAQNFKFNKDGSITQIDNSLENRRVGNYHNKGMTEAQKLTRTGDQAGAALNTVMNNYENIVSHGDELGFTKEMLDNILKSADKSREDFTQDAWEDRLNKPGVRLRFTLSPEDQANGTLGVVYYSDEFPNGDSFTLQRGDEVDNFFKAMQNSSGDYDTSANDAAGHSMYRKLAIPYAVDYEGPHKDNVEAAIGQAINTGDGNVYRNNELFKTGKYTTTDEHGFQEEHDFRKKERTGRNIVDTGDYYDAFVKALGSATPEQISEYLYTDKLTPSEYAKRAVREVPNPDNPNEPFKETYLTDDVINPMFEADKSVRNDFGDKSATNMRTNMKRVAEYLNALYGTDKDPNIIGKDYDSSMLKSLVGQINSIYRQKDDEGNPVNEGKSLADILSNPDVVLPGNWSKIAENNLPKPESKEAQEEQAKQRLNEIKTIRKIDQLLGSYNRKRLTDSKKGFNAQQFRDLIDSNKGALINAIENDDYSNVSGNNGTLSKEGAEYLLKELNNIRDIFTTPKDIEALIAEVPESIKKGQLSKLGKYDDKPINKLKEARDLLKMQLVESKQNNASGDTLKRVKKDLENLESRIAWMEKASPEIEERAALSGKDYNEAMADYIAEMSQQSEDGEYTDPDVKYFMENIAPKWNLQDRIRNMIGAAPGNEDAKRAKTLEILDRMDKAYPGVLPDLLNQRENIEGYSTGVPTQQLMSMLTSKNPTTLATAIGLLGGNMTPEVIQLFESGDKDKINEALKLSGAKITPEEAAIWANNRIRLRDQKANPGRYATKTWTKGSPIITKEQMREGMKGNLELPDDEYTKFAVQKQNADYGVGTHAKLKEDIDKLYDETGGHSDNYNSAASRLANAIANILSGINADNPGVN